MFKQVLITAYIKMHYMFSNYLSETLQLMIRIFFICW